MSVVFEIAHFSIAYQIGNIFKEGELDKSSSVEIFDRSENKECRSPTYCNFEVVISGESNRGTAFRRWVTLF